MNDSALDVVVTPEQYVAGLKVVLDSLPMADVLGVIESLHDTYQQRRHIFVAGNGGSAATASHMVCDLAKTVLGSSPHARRFRIVTLTDNVPLLTAWGNDARYEAVFAEQLRNLASAGDLLVVITVSGNSPNVVEAVKVARELGLRSVGLLGCDGGKVKDLLDRSVVIASDQYGYVEDAHMVVNHLITAHFRQLLHPSRR